MNRIKKQIGLFAMLLAGFSSYAQIIGSYDLSAIHNGVDYDSGIIRVCDGDVITFDAYLNPPFQYRVVAVDPNNYIWGCVAPNGGNAFQSMEIVDDYGMNSTTGGNSIDLTFDYDPGGNNLHYIASGVESQTCFWQNETGEASGMNSYEFRVEVYPSPSVIPNPAFNIVSDVSGNHIEVNALAQNTTDIIHTWEVDDGPTYNGNYETIMTGWSNGIVYREANIDLVDLSWPSTYFSEGCVMLKHTISSPCFGDVSYVKEVCFTGCDVNAEFTYNVNYVTNAGVANITLVTDETVNSPWITNFDGTWTMYDALGNDVTSQYPINSTNTFNIPAGEYFTFEYEVFTDHNPDCSDVYTTQLIIDGPPPHDCRSLNLTSESMFTQTANVPGAVFISPIVGYTPNGGLPVATPLSPNAIQYLTVNGVGIDLNSLIIPAVGPATLMGVSYGDIVCITFEFEGCLIEDCYRVVKVRKEGRDCDISLTVNTPIDGNKYPCKRVFVAMGADAVNGNMVWKVNGAVQTGNTSTSLTYTVGSNTTICVGTQDCPDVCVVESCEGGGRGRLANPAHAEDVDVFFTSRSEITFTGEGQVSNIVLYNVKGQRVYNMNDFELTGESTQEFTFDNNGIFFLRFELDGKVQSRKIVLE